ncbi:ATP-grasp domain-containing protein [Candidatus Babeliales bacterium]|nr:ATP-grasp domain-containing protein [Candidatus Babeliales bacterium]
MNKKIKKVLIANRSEISSRIIFTCKRLGIKTVSIYCPQDKFLPYVWQADQNYPLSKNDFCAYIAQDEIIKIALNTKSDAIHPGYGFLSENAQFAKKVIDAGLLWIGPSPKTIKQMSDKILAKKIMQKFNIPVINGAYLKIANKNSIKKKCEKIGFPIILKDPLGGGGKAIRKVNNPSELENTLKTVISEAKTLSNSNQILIEKYIEKGRHIEIQIAGDGKNFIHLYERECSIQRRHQKIIEESPCVFLDKNTLEKMYQTAIKTAKSVSYENIGTVEFIVTPNQNFYFLEMNTRLQVEHSVTELTTGLDLVEMQIKIAQTKQLPYSQKEISRNFHSIECRIYAEDPFKNFTPSSGKITNLKIPNGSFIRHDHNLEENQTITSFFDPMISKITTWGKNRQSAINNMIQALNQFEINGIKTNIALLKKIITSNEFLEGNIHTQLLNDSAYQKKIFSLKTKLANQDNELSEEEICTIITTLLNESKIYSTKKEHIPSKIKIKSNSQWRNKRWR